MDYNIIFCDDMKGYIISQKTLKYDSGGCNPYEKEKASIPEKILNH